jgi:DsbC/DsbD-like thiol-disulfide interchange protein
MRQLRKLSVKTRLLVFCIAGMSSLYASRLNPVSWSLEAEQEKVAPGSTVMLRLHAQIADGYHLYSFTAPSGSPIKTRAWLQSSPDIKGFRVYQPKPDRHEDPNLNVPVETFKSGIDFLLPTALANNASAGDKVVTASIRYQACSDQICLPPVTKMATTSITVQPGAAAAKASVPNGYQLVGDSESGRARERPQFRNLRSICVSRCWRLALG